MKSNKHQVETTGNESNKVWTQQDKRLYITTKMGPTIISLQDKHKNNKLKRKN